MTATLLLGACVAVGAAEAPPLLAGVSAVDITDYVAGPAVSPLYAKAVVLKQGDVSLAVVTVDAVAIAEIGRIGNDFLPNLRSRLESEAGIGPANLLVNASHCHGVVCADVLDRTLQAVKQALGQMVPVRVGAGVGHEDRVSENRRYTLKDGSQADSRHAYSLPPDEEIESVGPIDAEIGVLRLDREDGRTLAVLYNFACHPIQGVPSGANTADMTGFASTVVEDGFGEGAVTLFLQGCAGDINPAHYKEVHVPRDAEPLGTMLGGSVLKAARAIDCGDDARLTVINETLALPRADHSARIAALEEELGRLVSSLKGTTLNLKSFMELSQKYGLSPEQPSDYAQTYLHEVALGREDLKKLDEQNRRNMDAYRRNVYTMEEITRVQTNLALLRKHQADNEAVGMKDLEVEMLGVRIGDFALVTFPGEPSVQVGLHVKQASPHDLTFVAGYTNGYIYYAPTVDQARNTGSAQEDCDCILAPEWQAAFEAKAAELLGRL